MNHSPRWLRALLSKVRTGHPTNPSSNRPPRRLNVEALEDRTTPTAFTNATPIAIPLAGTDGTATPYSSDITVSGVATGAHISVSLNTLHHQKDSNLDILLVGPGGEKFILVSDAGGNGTLDPAIYTFSDSAPGTTTDSGLWITLSKPINFLTGDTFAAPAPAGPYLNDGSGGSTSASLDTAFGSSSPNGTWSLYVVDDANGGSGRMDGGWTISFNNDPTVATPISDHTFAGSGTKSYLIPSGTFTDVDGDALTYSANLAGGGALPSWLSFNPATQTTTRFAKSTTR